MFLDLKSLFFDYIFWEKSSSFWRAETPFALKNGSIFPRRNSILNFLFSEFWETINCSYYSWLKTPGGLLMALLDFSIFHVFVAEIIVFWYHFFFWKILSFWGADRPFPSRIFRSVFWERKSLWIFLNLKFKMHISSYPKGVCNF